MEVKGADGTVNKVIETRTAKVFLREDGIIQNDILPQAEISLQDAIESTSVGVSLSHGIKRPILVIFGDVKSLSREARAYFSGEEAAKATVAIALVISSHIGRLIGNFMIGLNKTVYPTRLFNTEDQAVVWLKGFLR